MKKFEQLMGLYIQHTNMHVMLLGYLMTTKSGMTSSRKHPIGPLLLKCVNFSAQYFYFARCPTKLWQTNWELLSEDIQRRQRRIFNFQSLELNSVQIKSLLLAEIEQLLAKGGKSLKDFPGCQYQIVQFFKI